MPSYSQNDRLISVHTSLGEDVLIATSIQGHEAISQLFHYEVEAFATNETEIPFHELIGQRLTVTVKTHGQADFRYFDGIISSMQRCGRDAGITMFRFQVVPKFWLLTRTTQSRIFQQMTVPEILKQVLGKLDVEWKILGNWEKRDYCVQYRESDFAFASRLMEEEGIFYFFTIDPKADNLHKMVISDQQQSFPQNPVDSIWQFYEIEGGNKDKEGVYGWEKSQHLRSAKLELMDHSFELAHKDLLAEETIQTEAQLGSTVHKFNVGNEDTELFDFPGGYAQRFDGIAPSGVEQPAELQKIFEDNKRTARLRMQQEAALSLSVEGQSTSPAVWPGFKFTLARHFSDDGQYLCTEHNFQFSQAAGSEAHTGSSASRAVQESQFRAIPIALPFLPQMVVPKPVIHGTQTAVVVGPEDEEIFVDKYGRVKVQFHWERPRKNNASASCWVRVASNWAGKQYGTMFIPRIGMEVVVAFEEGDPDCPLIVGCVYNSECMPPWELPANKTQSGIKTRSSARADNTNLNEFRFEDKLGNEHIFLHAEKDYHVRVKNEYRGYIGADFHETVAGQAMIKHAQNSNLDVGGNLLETVGGNMHLKVGGDFVVSCKNFTIDATGTGLIATGGNLKCDSSGDLALSAVGNGGFVASSAVAIKGGGTKFVAAGGGAYVTGPMVYINSGDMAVTVGGVAALSPSAAAAPSEPLEQGQAMLPPNPAGEDDGDENSETETEGEQHWIEIELVDDAGQPVAGEAVEVTLPDGKKRRGSTGRDGKYKTFSKTGGSAQVTFPRLDQDAWS